MSPEFSNMPTLLVDGTIKFGMQGADLTEAAASRNLNPAGAPYLCVTYSVTADAYPARLRGLVYVSGNAIIAENSVFEGVLWIRGKLNVTAGKTVTARWAALTDPIAGFSEATQMYVAAESVSRVAP
mgnify:CR=1 FL=1